MRLLLSLLFLVSGCLDVQAAEDVFVNLRPVVTSENSGPVHLIEIADLTARNAGSRVAAGRLVVASKFTGPVKTIKQAELQETLTPMLKALGIELVWGAESQVELRMAPRRVSLDAAIEQAAIELVRLFSQGRQLTVIPPDTAPQIALPAARVTTIAAIRRLQRHGDEIELPIDVFANDELVASPVIRYQLRYADTDKHLPTLRNRISAGYANSRVARDTGVRIVSTNGTIRLESQGIALGDAVRGELVSVRRAGSQASLLARVIDAETVMLENP